MIISAYMWATDSSHGCLGLKLVLPCRDYHKDTEQNWVEKPGYSLLPNSWHEDEGQKMGKGLGMTSRSVKKEFSSDEVLMVVLRTC